MTRATNGNKHKDHQLRLTGLDSKEKPKPLTGLVSKEATKPQTFRKKQLTLRKFRITNRERLKHLPVTEAEESVRF